MRKSLYLIAQNIDAPIAVGATPEQVSKTAKARLANAFCDCLPD
ncbi:MAG: hypothetical protein AAF941_10490 [Pseudomonadota bacterium]